MQNVFVVLYTADKSVDAPINQYYGVYSTLESAKRGIEVALDPRYGPDLSHLRFRIKNDFAYE
jgi:hypothetical protein